jgi:alanine racemase
MKAKQPYATWVEVDLERLYNNIKVIQETAHSPIMAVVKANGYGHGFMPITRTAEKAGVTWFGVARPRMAERMRQEGIEANILILGYIAPERMEKMICLDVSLSAWTPEHLQLISESAATCGKPAHVHLLVDSGMGRLGCLPEEALQLSHQITENENLIFEGLFSHLARADESDPQPTRLQEKSFNGVITNLDREGLLPDLIHFANSAGSLAHSSTRHHLIRPGIILYGMAPSPEIELPAGIQPILSWKSVLASVKKLPAGHGVSYGHAYVTSESELIGVVPVGYADGYRRVAGGQVLINGAKAPIIGRVCMDQFMVKLENVPDPRVGDEVVLIGSQADQKITADDLAALWQTINYEVTCGIGARVPRIFPKQDS